MRIFVGGATGFIGRALVLRLRREGHEIVVWARSVERAREVLGAEVECLPLDADPERLSAALSGVDAVVNLSGASLLERRWSAARRKELRDSRVEVNARLVDALAAAVRRPKVFVSGSAVGYYGDRGDEVLTEDSPPATDFLAELCVDWERSALAARDLGVRVVTLRTGIVLGLGGGALAQMLPAFQAGVGGPISNGRQFVAWIHLHDLVSLIHATIVDQRYRGPVNAVAPSPVTSRDFARALGRALGRPALVPVPRPMLRLIFGEAAAPIVSSQRALPSRALALDFPFEFPALAGALHDLLGGDGVDIAALTADSPAPSAAGDGYLQQRRPRYLLSSRITLDAPLDETFAFFSRPENLGLLTPPDMAFRITGDVAAMGDGAAIDYSLRVGPFPVRWRSRIERYQPARCFIDSQLAGPYRSWWHEHHFRDDGGRTVLEDRVYYAPPLGLLGRLAHRLFVAGALRRIFGYRRGAIRLRFGAPAQS